MSHACFHERRRVSRGCRGVRSPYSQESGGSSGSPKPRFHRRRSQPMNPIVRLALEEDIGTGDVTSAACVPETRMATGRFLAREPLILAGVDLLSEIYGARGGVAELRVLKRDGDSCADGDVIAHVCGRART